MIFVGSFEFSDGQSPVEVAKSSFENISLLKAIWLIG